jgi:hypothetical protein
MVNKLTPKEKMPLDLMQANQALLKIPEIQTWLPEEGLIKEEEEEAPKLQTNLIPKIKLELEAMVQKMKTIEEAINQIIRWSFIKVQMEQTLMLITQDLTKDQ